MSALALASESQSQLQDISEKDVVSIVLPLLYIKDDLHLMAERIRTTIISSIRPNDLPTRVYRFRIDKFCSIYGLNSEKIYEDLKKGLRELRSGFELPIEKGAGTGWISSWEITDAEVHVVLSKIIQDFYKKKAISKFRVENIRGFVYAVTYKFYKMFIVALGEEKEIELTKEIEELKDQVCGRTRYEKYSDFKRRVLMPAIANINGEKLSQKSRINDKENMCDIRVSFEEIKEKRSVVGIKFKIARIRESVGQQISLDPWYESLTSDGQQAYTVLRDTIGASKSSIINCTNKYGEETMIKIAQMVITKLAEPNCKINNPGAYAGQCLRSGDIFGVGVIRGSEIIDAEVVDEERDQLCDDLIAAGLTKSYVTKLHKDKNVSTRRIRESLRRYNERLGNGDDVQPGWLRKCIDTDYLWIDTPNPVEEAKRKEQERKLNSMSPEMRARFEKNEAEKRTAQVLAEESKPIVAIEIIDEVTRRKNEAEEALIDMGVKSFVSNIEPDEEEAVIDKMFSSMPQFQIDFLSNRGYSKNMSLEELAQEPMLYSKIVTIYKEKYANN